MTRAARARKQLKIPEPVLEFRVWPEKKLASQAWNVAIFKTRGQMRRYLKFLRPGRDFSGTWAFTDEKSRTMVFCLWTMSDNVITHECHHAIVWWINQQFRCVGDCLLWDNEKHERAAEAHGNMVSAIWENFTRAGFKREQCWGFEPLDSQRKPK